MVLKLIKLIGGASMIWCLSRDIHFLMVYWPNGDITTGYFQLHILYTCMTLVSWGHGTSGYSLSFVTQYMKMLPGLYLENKIANYNKRMAENIKQYRNKLTKQIYLDMYKKYKYFVSRYSTCLALEFGISEIQLILCLHEIVFSVLRGLHKMPYVSFFFVISKNSVEAMSRLTRIFIISITANKLQQQMDIFLIKLRKERILCQNNKRIQHMDLLLKMGRILRLDLSPNNMFMINNQLILKALGTAMANIAVAIQINIVPPYFIEHSNYYEFKNVSSQ